MKCGRKSLSCEELAADLKPPTGIMKKVGERWERRMSERGLGKRMLRFDVICDSQRRKTEMHPPFCTRMRGEKGCVLHWAENQSALREGAVKYN